MSTITPLPPIILSLLSHFQYQSICGILGQVSLPIHDYLLDYRMSLIIILILVGFIRISEVFVVVVVVVFETVSLCSLVPVLDLAM